MQHMNTTTFRGFHIYSLKIPTINVHAFYSEILICFKNHKCISNFLKSITIQVFTEYRCLKNCNWVKLISSMPYHAMQLSDMCIHDFWVYENPPQELQYLTQPIFLLVQEVEKAQAPQPWNEDHWAKSQ